MPTPDPNSVKRRIIAMKIAHPEMMPHEIARALGSTRKYANAVLGEMLLTRTYAVEEEHHVSSAHGQVGSGRRQSGEYVKLM